MNILVFLYRFLINLSKLVLLCLPLEILGWLLLLPACFFSKSSKLPVYLRYFDNADLYVDRDASVYMQVIDSGWFNRYYWLAFRNPINYFGYKVLGVGPLEYQPILSTITTAVNNQYQVGDSQGKHAGYLYQECLINNNSYYEYYFIYKYSANYCFRFRMGHKIGEPASNPVGSYIQFCFIIQPYKSYTGD